MARKTQPAGKFSYPIRRDDVPADGLTRKLEATPEQCAAIAGELGIVSVEDLTAVLEVKRWRGSGLSVTGSFHGRIVQISVVSLEPAVEEVSEELALKFLPEGDGNARAVASPEIVVDALAEDPPETLAPDGIDLGILVIEHLAMAMNPYPRKAGEEFAADEVVYPIERGESGEKTDNPFAVLETLKRGGKGN